MYLGTDALGYLTHENAYSWGGYEVLTSIFSRSAGRILGDAVAKAARDMWDELKVGGYVPLMPRAGAGRAPENDMGSQ